MESKLGLRVLICLSLGAVLATGCVGDKTLDQYRAEKAKQAAAANQAIAGTYRGEVLAKGDQSLMGTVTLTLVPDSRVTNSYDNLGTEEQSIVQGTITYRGLSTATATFNQAYFDREDGTFQAELMVPNSANVLVPMTLSGTISGGEFSGEIEAKGYPDFGGLVTLYLNGPEPESANLTDGTGRLGQIRSENQVFAGETSPISNQLDPSQPATPLQATLLLQYPTVTSDQVFLNLFMPSRPVVAYLTIGPTPITFDDAYIDDQTHMLQGNAVINDGSAKFVAQLHCTGALSTAGMTTSWSCVMTTGQDSIRMVLKPRAS